MCRDGMIHIFVVWLKSITFMDETFPIPFPTNKCKTVPNELCKHFTRAIVFEHKAMNYILK